MGRNGHNCSIVDFERTKTQPWSDQIIPFSILDIYWHEQFELKIKFKKLVQSQDLLLRKTEDSWRLGIATTRVIDSRYWALYGPIHNELLHIDRLHADTEAALEELILYIIPTRLDLQD